MSQINVTTEFILKTDGAEAKLRRYDGLFTDVVKKWASQSIDVPVRLAGLDRLHRDLDEVLRKAQSITGHFTGSDSIRSTSGPGSGVATDAIRRNGTTALTAQNVRIFSEAFRQCTGHFTTEFRRICDEHVRMLGSTLRANGGGRGGGGGSLGGGGGGSSSGGSNGGRGRGAGSFYGGNGKRPFLWSGKKVDMTFDEQMQAIDISFATGEELPQEMKAQDLLLWKTGKHPAQQKNPSLQTRAYAAATKWGGRLFAAQAVMSGITAGASLTKFGLEDDPAQAEVYRRKTLDAIGEIPIVGGAIRSTGGMAYSHISSIGNLFAHGRYEDDYEYAGRLAMERDQKKPAFAARNRRILAGIDDQHVSTLRGFDQQKQDIVEHYADVQSKEHRELNAREKEAMAEGLKAVEAERQQYQRQYDRSLRLDQFQAQLFSDRLRMHTQAQRLSVNGLDAFAQIAVRHEGRRQERDTIKAEYEVETNADQKAVKYAKLKAFEADMPAKDQLDRQEYNKTLRRASFAGFMQRQERGLQVDVGELRAVGKTRQAAIDEQLGQLNLQKRQLEFAAQNGTELERVQAREQLKGWDTYETKARKNIQGMDDLRAADIVFGAQQQTAVARTAAAGVDSANTFASFNASVAIQNRQVERNERPEVVKAVKDQQQQQGKALLAQQDRVNAEKKLAAQVTDEANRRGQYAAQVLQITETYKLQLERLNEALKAETLTAEQRQRLRTERDVLGAQFRASRESLRIQREIDIQTMQNRVFVSNVQLRGSSYQAQLADAQTRRDEAINKVRPDDKEKIDLINKQYENEAAHIARSRRYEMEDSRVRIEANRLRMMGQSMTADMKEFIHSMKRYVEEAGKDIELRKSRGEEAKSEIMTRAFGMGQMRFAHSAEELWYAAAQGMANREGAQAEAIRGIQQIDDLANKKPEDIEKERVQDKPKPGHEPPWAADNPAHPASPPTKPPREPDPPMQPDPVRQPSRPVNRQREADKQAEEAARYKKGRDDALLEGKQRQDVEDEKRRKRMQRGNIFDFGNMDAPQSNATIHIPTLDQLNTQTPITNTNALPRINGDESGGMNPRVVGEQIGNAMTSAMKPTLESLQSAAKSLGEYSGKLSQPT